MKHRDLKLVRLAITYEDIEEMYDRYDSGMADRTTANAVCLALRKILLPEYHPQVVLASRHHACRLKVDSEYFSLSNELFWWLHETNVGGTVSPTSFAIVLPEEMFKEEPTAREEVETAIAA